MAASHPHDQLDPACDELFESIYRAEAGYVWRTARRLWGDRADLEDVVHDVFLVVQRKLPDYDRDRPVRPWLFGIAYRVVLGARRKRKREVLSSELERAAVGPRQVEDLEQARARATLLWAMEGLTIDERAVFASHDIDECAAPEVASILEIPVNTVYSRLRRARKKLARRIRSRGGRP